MELIKSAARRTVWGEAIYVVLNLAYAGLLFGLVMVFDPPWLAYLAVVLSKWRVFAVRPRFWFANLQANVADALVGASFVTLLWITPGQLIVQALLFLMFLGWLIFIKPRSKRHWVLIQAAIGQFFGLAALFSLSYELFASVVVAVAWIIGYSMARHVLSSYHDETERTLLSLVWGFVVAELAWLSQHWTIAYAISGELMIPQIAIVSTLLGFLAIRTYDVLHKEGKRRFQELRWPIVFVVVIIVALLVRFNGLDMTQL